jgi:hypothetical protein
MIDFNDEERWYRVQERDIKSRDAKDYIHRAVSRINSCIENSIK